MLMIDPPRSGIFGTHARMKLRDAREVLADQRVLALVVHVEERGLEAAARVVDEHVDGVERADPRANGVTVARRRAVAVSRVPAGLLDLLGGAREPVGIAVADRDVGTEAGERGRDRRADPLRGAGDDRDAVRSAARTRA